MPSTQDDVRVGSAWHTECRLDVPATVAIVSAAFGAHGGAVSLVLATASIAGIVALARDSMGGGWPSTCCVW